MSAASPLSTSDQLIAPAFFTNAPDAGLFIRSLQHWVRPPPSQFVPAFPAAAWSQRAMAPEQGKPADVTILAPMKRGRFAAIAGAILLAGAVFAWNAVRQEREFRRLIA